MGDTAAPVCPLCGCRFDPLEHRWKERAPLPGRRSGWVWAHTNPASGKKCAFVDGGPLDHYTNTASRGTIVDIKQRRDAPDEARRTG